MTNHSTTFWHNILGFTSSLHVEGMTETFDEYELVFALRNRFLKEQINEELIELACWREHHDHKHSK